MHGFQLNPSSQDRAPLVKDHKDFPSDSVLSFQEICEQQGGLRRDVKKAPNSIVFFVNLIELIYPNLRSLPFFRSLLSDSFYRGKAVAEVVATEKGKAEVGGKLLNQRMTSTMQTSSKPKSKTQSPVVTTATEKTKLLNSNLRKPKPHAEKDPAKCLLKSAQQIRRQGVVLLRVLPRVLLRGKSRSVQKGMSRSLQNHPAANAASKMRQDVGIDMRFTKRQSQRARSKPKQLSKPFATPESPC